MNRRSINSFAISAPTGISSLISYRNPARGQIPPETLQIGADFRRGLVADIAVLLKRLVDDLIPADGDVRIQPDCRGVIEMARKLAVRLYWMWAKGWD